ncbi:MAG: hypothetical protein IPG10_11195 [Flavobacteriales bacterium]|nr:hypothetical protein [Flavobacteriales bacterium]
MTTGSSLNGYPKLTTSHVFAMMAFTEPDDVYVFKNRLTGKKVKVYAKSMSQAGERLAKGKYEDYR